MEFPFTIKVEDSEKARVLLDLLNSLESLDFIETVSTPRLACFETPGKIKED